MKWTMLLMCLTLLRYRTVQCSVSGEGCTIWNAGQSTEVTSQEHRANHMIPYKTRFRTTSFPFDFYPSKHCAFLPRVCCRSKQTQRHLYSTAFSKRPSSRKFVTTFLVETSPTLFTTFSIILRLPGMDECRFICKAFLVFILVRLAGNGWYFLKV
jgi:hypothetical protein